MILNIIFIIAGFILLIKGADALVDGSSGIAKKFHIPEIIIGLTIVSIGTSVPELFVSVTSALNGYQDMAIGNVVGSNLCNLLLILGLSAIINPIIIRKETKYIEIPMCIFFTILFMILCNVGQNISRVDAIILLICFAGFIGYTIYQGVKSSGEFKKEKKDEEKDKSVIWHVLYIVLGIIALKFGGDFVVENAKQIAESLNISEKIISVTIIAIGTSLPELMTSVTAAIKKDSDIAIGNILGSNIFNMLEIIGVSAIINPITFNLSYNLEMIILIVSTIVLGLFAYTDVKDEMTKSNGITYVMLYGLYMALLFVR